MSFGGSQPCKATIRSNDPLEMAAHSITDPEPCLKVGMRRCQAMASLCSLPPNSCGKHIHEKDFKTNIRPQDLFQMLQCEGLAVQQKVP